MKQPRILFYCQYLLGLGHLTRSLALSEALAQKFDVDLVLGGPLVERKVRTPNLKIIPLDPLLMREADSRLYSPADVDVATVFARREDQLTEMLNQQSYDVLVTELFPFGRGKFKSEILKLIELFRKRNPRGLVVSSLRDILVKREGQGDKEQKMAEVARDHFDWVLVHSDSELIRLEHTFPLTGMIAEKLYYTGFVCESSQSNARPGGRRQEVMVSLGGGSVGEELIAAVLEVAKLAPDFVFRFKISPYFSPRSHQLLKDYKSQNIKAEPFSTNFEAELQEVSLSISMGGYNTVMNVVNTSTPALVWPYDANQEQSMRAKILERHGFLRCLTVQDLQNPQRMLSSIRERLAASYPQWRPNLNGGKCSADFLLSLMDDRK